VIPLVFFTFEGLFQLRPIEFIILGFDLSSSSGDDNLFDKIAIEDHVVM